MSQPHSQVASALQSLRALRDARRITRLVSPHQTIKVTRQHRPDRRERQEVFLVTIGKPNFVERQLIKTARKNGVCFPIGRIQRFPKIAKASARKMKKAA